KIGAGKFDSFPADKEHGYSRAVFAGVENLPRFELFGIKSDFRLAEQSALASFDVVAIDRARTRVACKRIKRLAVVSPAGKATGRAQIGERHSPNLFAGQVENPRGRAAIVE